MRRVVFAVIGLGLVAVIAIGLTQSEGHNAKPKPVALSRSAQRAKLAGAPPALARLHDRASRLIEATPADFRAVLRGLRGHPVVVNGWASWCGPCKFEFPFFQKAAVDDGRRVAFVGLDVTDNHDDAHSFLGRFPVAYPSYEDPSAKIVRALHAPQGVPFTIYFDARGRQSYLHQGAYATAAKLEADIQRYAVDA
jgi:thiol-disulfide isomerase/thioredoxin